MKWEYMTLAISAGGFFLGGKIDGQALTDRLNVCGQDGWELVTVFDTNIHQGATRDVFALLKRSTSAANS